ncbi:MAG: SOS response-associated peptidase, partial [Alphaproteobacteria bacterium]
MCGRYSLTVPEEAMRQLFDLPAAGWMSPRFNISPSQIAPVLRRDENSGRMVVDGMTWGLIPSWTKQSTGGQKIQAGQINARSETAAEKPTFRAAYRRRRCLIPADGFYEWQKWNGTKQPFYIARADGAPFAFAGLWERWDGGGEGLAEAPPLESCAIVTTDANERVAPVHDRMSVILAPSDYALWLDPRVDDLPILEALLRPCPADDLFVWPVSTHVNSPAH